MFRVRRSKLPLLASAVGASLPAWGFAQFTATWTYGGPSGDGLNNWGATWTDNTGLKPWFPNATYPNSPTASPVFAGTFTRNAQGTITLNLGVTVNSLNFYGAGTTDLTAPGNVNNIGYTVKGTGSITIIPNAGTTVGTIDVSSIGRDNTIPATPITLPGVATISTSIIQSSGSLYKTGVGTLVLTGSNNFTGADKLQIDGGVVRAVGSNSLSGLQVFATGNNGALELYNDASNITSGGTVFFGGLGSGTPSANGVIAAMGGSNSTWGGANSFLFIYGNPSVGAGASSTLTISASIIDAGTNGLTKQGAGTVITGGLALNGPLTINNGRLKIKQGGGTINTSVVNALTIAGGGTPTGMIDLTDHALVVRNSTGSNVVAMNNIQALIKKGRGTAAYPDGVADGQWNGTTGIGSSKAQADFTGDGFETHVIGYGENDLMPLGGFATFGGVSVGANDILVRYTVGGDATLDGWCGDNDVSIIAGFYDNGATSGHHWYEGDFNYDGLVNDSDVSILAGLYQGAEPGDLPYFGPPVMSPAFAEVWTSALAAVPEPTSMTLIGLGTLALAGRRRRK